MAIIKIYAEGNFVAVDEGGTDINYIPVGSTDFDALGNGDYCVFNTDKRQSDNYSFNYVDVRTKAGAVIGGGTENEVTLSFTTFFNSASGGSGADNDTQTISWSRSTPSVAINTILVHNDIGVSQVGVPIIYDGFIKKIGYSTRGTKDSGGYTYDNWGVRFDIQRLGGGVDSYTEYLSGANSAGAITISTPITVGAGDEIWCYVINGDGTAITSIAYPVIEISTDKNI